MYHTVVYNAPAAGVNTVNLDFTAALDSEVTQRNGHYTFSEDYKLLGAAIVGVSVIRGRFQVPHWNAYAEFNLFNANRAITPPSNPQWDLWQAYPPLIPQEEEFQVQVSNNLGAATEVENVVLMLGTADWNQNLRKGELVVAARATFTLTPVLNAWSGGQVIAFTQSLRGGTWLIIGAAVQGANAVAYRWLFPRNRMYHGRRLRPGGLVQTAIGDQLNQQADPWVLTWGEVGAFHTFELPQIEVFGTVAGSITYQVFVWMVYLGQSRSILDQYVAGGS
jgi:hypothetical protein